MQHTLFSRRQILFTMLSICLLPLWSIPAESQPNESAIGGQNLETSRRVITSQAFPGWAYMIGETETFNPQNNINPGNVYVSVSNPAGTLTQGVSYSLEGWEVDASIVEIEDGNDFVWTTGVLNQNTGSFDMMVLRGNITGAVSWTTTLGGFQRDGGTSIIRLSDATGDIIVAGWTESFGAGCRDGVLARLNVATGAVVWMTTYGGAANDELYCVREGLPGDPNLYAVGSSNSFGPAAAADDDVWLLVVTAAGGVISYSNVYGGAANDRGFSLVLTEDPCGGPRTLTIAGETCSFGSALSDIYLIRTGLGAAVLPTWEFRYEAFAGGWDKAYGITNAANSCETNVVVVGQVNDVAAGAAAARGEGFAMEVPGAGGAPLWFNTYGRLDFETFRSVDNNLGAVYYFAGTTYSNGAGAGDQYLVNADVVGMSGTDAAGTPCAMPLVPTDVAVTSFTPATVVATPFVTTPAPPVVTNVAGILTRICTSPTPFPVTGTTSALNLEEAMRAGEQHSDTR